MLNMNGHNTSFENEPFQMSSMSYKPLPPPHSSLINSNEYGIRVAPGDGADSETLQSLPQLLHWSEVVYECANVTIEEWNLAGGSNYGHMPYFVDSGDIILEVNGHKVAGLTRLDVLELLSSEPTNVIRAVSSNSSYGLPIDLKEFLSRRFMRNSTDHDLQPTIRDNVYMRTLPITTRPPRPGEINNVDYKFVSREEFLVLERSGVLLESGMFEQHHYGTPLPLSNPNTPTVNSNNQHEMNAENSEMGPAGLSHGYSNPDVYELNAINNNSSNYNGYGSVEQAPQPVQPSASMSLAAKRKRNRSNIAAIDASSLPHGWEKITDPTYGVYFIDHVNRRTCYERPFETNLTKGANGFGFTLIELALGLVVVKNIIPGGPAYVSGVIQPGDVLVSVSGVSVHGFEHSDIARLFSTFVVGDRVKITFARGYQLPPEMVSNDDSEFEQHSVSITKGSSGFGFTISDGNAGQKVKKILDVDRCGNLRQGDVLVSVNSLPLEPLPHTQVVEVLKNCKIGDTARITVKRKKRFRSKTPTSLQSTNYVDRENAQPPPRNCKTPSCEMMMRRDSDWAEDNRMTPTSQTRLSNGQDTRDMPTTSYDDASLDPNLNHLYSNGDFHNLYDQRSQMPAMKSAPQLLHPRGPLQNGDLISPVPQIAATPDVEKNASLPAGYTNEEEYEYYRVVLSRSEAGFGFRIVGGAEEGRNVAIGSIVIGGVAHQDGILKSGDDIISINERSVMGASHHHVVELMGQCGQNVSLLVRRKKDSDAFEVALQREANEGFGFVIISCGNCALIGRIIDKSPAQRCQRLRIRDRIIAVNGVDITEMSHPDIVNMIKESGRELCLKIIPSDCYTVELVRGPRGFGFSIRGGAEFNCMPLFILRIAPDGPAFSLLTVGDEIIEINGIFTVGMSHTEAVQLISQSGPQVKLKLRRNGPPVHLSPGSNFVHQSQTPPQLTPSMSYGGEAFGSSGVRPQSPSTMAYAPHGFSYSYSAPNGVAAHSPTLHEAHHVNTYSSP